MTFKVTNEQLAAYKRLQGLRGLCASYEVMICTLTALTPFDDEAGELDCPTIPGLTVKQTRDAIEPYYEQADAWCRGMWSLIDPNTVPPLECDGIEVLGFELLEWLTDAIDEIEETTMPGDLERQVLRAIDPELADAIEEQERIQGVWLEEEDVQILEAMQELRASGSQTH